MYIHTQFLTRKSKKWFYFLHLVVEPKARHMSNALKLFLQSTEIKQRIWAERKKIEWHFLLPSICHSKEKHKWKIIQIRDTSYLHLEVSLSSCPRFELNTETRMKWDCWKLDSRFHAFYYFSNLSIKFSIWAFDLDHIMIFSGWHQIRMVITYSLICF